MKRELSMDALIAATGTPAEEAPPEEHDGPCRGCEQFASLLTGRHGTWTADDVMDARVLAALIWWSELDDEGVCDLQWADAALQQGIEEEDWAASKKRLVTQGAVKWIGGRWYVTPKEQREVA
jgi:hypothetical protein